MLKFLSMGDDDNNNDADAGPMTIVLQTFMFWWTKND